LTKTLELENFLIWKKKEKEKREKEKREKF
jgi:hypothetical protein